jgi:acetyl-CoA carboxylase biotin carboxyl carrier protein
LPWLAALFLRAFFLRVFLAMAGSYAARSWRRAPGAAIHNGLALVIGYRGTPRTGSDQERITMADEIRAEMVANVWKVVKAAGDAVAEGDTLVILESMKMEIPVLAESDGTIVELAVNEGDVVQEGDLIAVVE